MLDVILISGIHFEELFFILKKSPVWDKPKADEHSILQFDKNLGPVA